jgi:serine/threonine-protein kinase HipA
MRKALVYVQEKKAGILEELENSHYRFSYLDDYKGAPISLTMPLENRIYEFDTFPPFFDGLLPEGILLEALLRKYKLDKNDYFAQLLKVGHDVVGAVTIEELQ